MKNIIKIILAVLFFLCLLDMPYGFFQFVRFSALIGFSLLAYNSYQENKQTEMVAFLALTIMFQPIFKISFGRQLWNLIDVIIGAVLLISVFAKSKK